MTHPRKIRNTSSASTHRSRSRYLECPLIGDFIALTEFALCTVKSVKTEILMHGLRKLGPCSKTCLNILQYEKQTHTVNSNGRVQQ